MKKTLLKYLPEISGSVLGGVGGFLYWKYAGCVSGTCTIKSNWYFMVPWGIVLGYLVGSLIKDIAGKIKKTGPKEDS